MHKFIRVALVVAFVVGLFSRRRPAPSLRCRGCRRLSSGRIEPLDEILCDV
jgi:hypothetical protein